MPIRILSSDVSSQISAGEIIEKPASVVKEIIENSIDAGAKNIKIIIEKSGFKSIILQDDGCGIDKSDLLLSIEHHATSKINSLSDLDTINTFGFRGEALASIRAVSRLTLISSTHFDDIAWKIYSEGFTDNHIDLQPIAHPKGTTIIVENLFYNIPVRLKFIRHEKLEFVKILEIIKKIALSHFYINFSLKHNNKLILQYDAIKNKKNKINRLKDVLNKVVESNKMIQIQLKKHDIFLFGWISYPQNFKKIKNIQYCYINNRFVNNNLVINAVRSACLRTFGNRSILFILYLNIPSNQIDINIHPTKNEIRFHKSNLVHSLIYEAILYNLIRIKKEYFLNVFSSKKNSTVCEKKEENLNSFNSDFSKLKSLLLFKNNMFSNYENITEKKNNILNFNNFLKNYNCSTGKLLTVTRKYYGLIHHHDDFLLLSFPVAQGMIRKEQFNRNIQNKTIPEYHLTCIKINITYEEYKILFYNKKILLKIGFNLILKKKYVILKSIPYFLKNKSVYLIILDFFAFLFLKKRILISEVVDWFYKKIFIELKNWDYIDGIKLLLEIEYYYPLFLINSSPKLIQKININKALCLMKI